VQTGNRPTKRNLDFSGSAEILLLRGLLGSDSNPRPQHAVHLASKKLSNQNCCRIIITWQVGDMSLERHFRSGSQLRIWIRPLLASVVLIATLAARNVAPHFPQAPGLHFTISADSHHDQRPRFVHSSSEWGVPDKNSLRVPPADKSAHLTPAPQPFFTPQTKGVHYDRPPPIC